MDVYYHCIVWYFHGGENYQKYIGIGAKEVREN
jgi:hypothetical protein